MGTRGEVGRRVEGYSRDLRRLLLKQDTLAGWGMLPLEVVLSLLCTISVLRKGRLERSR